MCATTLKNAFPSFNPVQLLLGRLKFGVLLAWMAAFMLVSGTAMASNTENSTVETIVVPANTETETPATDTTSTVSHPDASNIENKDVTPVSEELIPKPDPSTLSLSSSDTPPTEKPAEPQTQLDIEKEALNNTYLFAAWALILGLPFLPALILRWNIDSPDGVAFVNGYELLSYLMGASFTNFGYTGMRDFQSYIYKSVSMAIFLGGIVVLLAMFGLQRQLSKNLFRTIVMFCTKIAYIVLTLLASVVLMLISMFFAKNSYESAKNKEYAKAAVNLGGAVATARASRGMLEGWERYINGYDYPAVAAAFTDDGLWAVIKQGFTGFRGKYAYGGTPSSNHQWRSAM